MKKGKSNFFLIAPFALWGCISVWTSNLVRLTDKSAVPYREFLFRLVNLPQTY